MKNSFCVQSLIDCFLEKNFMHSKSKRLQLFIFFPVSLIFAVQLQAQSLNVTISPNPVPAGSTFNVTFQVTGARNFRTYTISIPTCTNCTSPMTLCQVNTDNNGSGNCTSQFTAASSGSQISIDAIATGPGSGSTTINIPGSTTAALPVELTQFDVQSKDDMVELAWTTATELNNDFFQIEHSRDGIQFDAVGKVKGVGTTTETINYNFMHRQPASGTNYYRLKQVDFDGAYEYSDIISVEVYSRTNGIRVYPNPTVDRVFIQVDKQPKDIQFALTTILGQKVDVQPATGDFGWELDLARLPKGIYVLQLDYDGKSLTKRIVKE